MVEDVMNGDHLIGMVQPLVPRQDNQLPIDEEASPESLELSAEAEPELYEVGCMGQVEECKSLPGGRYAIGLLGLTRFRVMEEMPLQRGYRRVAVSLAEFSQDLVAQEPEEAPENLLASLSAFGTRYDFSFDLERLQTLPRMTLVNGLSMALPFAPAEKQALLEADFEERQKILETLLAMGVDLEEALEPKVVDPN